MNDKKHTINPWTKEELEQLAKSMKRQKDRIKKISESDNEAIWEAWDSGNPANHQEPSVKQKK
ncbi:MAG: hypothetical protein G01um101418_60 [Parcubacteria group bacterium Gr01-1014_18]|nr:MAG: hypothetical protein Greene041636_60 [Parcubacteria group bacterium Greene0416_36]TSC81566.1 MAG: hypothetical protein G01um101418_60 [Parcubacteria group bacterium Gr01-1014_18]TSC99623.1 MAG: hypothetical protein Greene101420_27 [Parcubacteria group bacterium Greene1014_20]TSD07074.1 MAG: hypothetical protein Greene07142_386 [Parcubacteria group bacterium Greene0714_2]